MAMLIVKTSAKLALACLLASFIAAPARLSAQEASPPEVEALLQQLEDEDATERFNAAEALGKLGPAAAEATPALIGRLTDREMRITGRLRTVEDQVWVAASKALSAIGEPAVPGLIEALDSDDPQIVRGAALSLHVIGPPAKAAAPKLIAILERNDDETRHQAILGLAGIGPEAKDATPLLIEMLKHDDFHTQYQAARALAKIGDAAAPAVPVLVELLSHSITSVRRNAAVALGDMNAVGGDEAIAGLVKTLEDPIEPVREAAVTALGQFGPRAKAAIAPLQDLLKRKRLATPTATLLAIYRITGESEEAVPLLLAEIDRPDAPWAAAAALAQIKPTTPAIVEGLAARLKSPDGEARYSCAQALGEIGPDARAAEPALQALLEDEDETVREAAKKALEQIGGMP